MRTIIPFVVILICSVSAYSKSLFFERGLTHNKCYRENVKYECSEDCKSCTLHLFPDIKAQLSIEAAGLSDFCKVHKTDTGVATFQFKEVQEVATADVFGFIKTDKQLSESWTMQSDLMIKPVNCAKK